MGLVDAIASLANGDDDGGLVVTRTARGTTSSGIYTPGSTSTFPIVAIVQPATGQQRVVGGLDTHGLPSGMQVDDVRVLYTEAQLSTVNDSSFLDADRVQFDGEPWVVFRSEPWDLVGGRYWRITIALLTEGGS